MVWGKIPDRVEEMFLRRKVDIVRGAFIVLFACLAIACLVIGHPHGANHAHSASTMVSTAQMSGMHHQSTPASPSHQPANPADGGDSHCVAASAALCGLPGAATTFLLLLASVVGLGHMLGSTGRCLRICDRARHFLLDVVAPPHVSRPALVVLCVSRI